MSDQLDIGKLRARKQQPMDRIRDAFARAHKIATGGRAHYMSIPADSERDADLILSDAIDELEALRNAAPALLDAAEERDQLTERNAKLASRVSYYESTLCFNPPSLRQLESGAVTGAIEPERIGDVVTERDALRAEVAKLQLSASDVEFYGNEQVKALRAENERLREALTPSGATKAAYMGEFEFDVQGERGTFGASVPWTTIKEIMAAISKRADLRPTEGEVKP